MNYFRIILIIALILEIICVSMLVGDAVNFYIRGEWHLFPVLTMHKYQVTGGFDYDIVNEARMYIEKLNANDRAVPYYLLNTTLVLSLFCALIYIFGKFAIKHNCEKSTQYLCGLNVLFAIGIIAFLRLYMRSSYGDITASNYFPVAYLSIPTIILFIITYFGVLLLVRIFCGKETS